MLGILLAIGAALIGGKLAFPASAQTPLHGIGFAKGCNSPVTVGYPYQCNVLTINNVDSAGDTLTITSLVDVVNSGGGPVTSGNLLPSLSLSFSGGSSCAPGQTICTLPAGSSISTNAPFSFYTVQSTDPNPLTDTATLTWQDLCTSAAPNCPVGNQSATAGSSAVVQTPTPTPTNTPTNTPTATPTKTNTPTATPTQISTVVGGGSVTPVSTTTPPSQFKVPCGNPTVGNTATPTPGAGSGCQTAVASGNVNLNGPTANLFICQTPAPSGCTGPGEGHLVVYENVSNVQTTDYPPLDPPLGDGIGAYEFQVEFDNFVIQSVNPMDVIFTQGGGTRDGGAGPFPALGRGAPNCSNSITSENSVRFGCVTLGQNDGPNGDFTLAKLDLIPAADDVKDLFPGNDNGIPTLIKDNQCELADILGHPVLGTVGNAGQLPSCGDIFVTIRILEGDINLDCIVDVNDEAIIAQHYGAFFGSAFYQKWLDLEPKFHDLDIDIKDLQKVFGRDGSTCQNPIPAQTPVTPPFSLND